MVKTITIKESVFNRLTLQKKEDESFSDLFERLIDNQISGIELLRKLGSSVEFWIHLLKSNRKKEGKGGYMFWYF